MQRLSVEILKKMCSSHLTRCEIDFLLAVSRYQDESGKVTGVYYKDIAADMGFSIPQFYAAKKTLTKKGFIKCEKNNYYDHDITIIGNSYMDIHKLVKISFKDKPYINTNRVIFYDKAFRKLKPGAKLLAMLFVVLLKNEDWSSKKSVDNFFKEYGQLLGVKERILRVYITQLKEFFSIGIVQGMYRIRAKKGRVFPYAEKKEVDNYNEQLIKKVCRRSRIKVLQEADTEKIRSNIKQYRDRAIRAGKDILAVIDEAIRRSVDPLEEMSSPKSVLKPKLVHLWIKRLLGIAENEKGEEQPETASESTIESGGNSSGADRAAVKNNFNNFHQRDYDYEAVEAALLAAQKA